MVFERVTELIYLYFELWATMYTSYGLLYFEDIDVVSCMMNEIILEYFIFELWKAMMFE